MAPMTKISKRPFSAVEGDLASSTRKSRQPQTSCDFCRSKKLKCDRATPCSNCTARRVTCQTKGIAIVAGEAVHRGIGNSEVLERLRRLESAVFGLSESHDPQKTLGGSPGSNIESNDGRAVSEIQHRPTITRGISNIQPGAVAGGTISSMLLDHHEKIVFRVVGDAESLDGGHDRSPVSDFNSLYCIWLPTERDALALFQDYAEHPSYLIPALHEPSARALITDMYRRLAQREEVSMGEGAFLLSIAAMSAFLWDSRCTACHPFESEIAAAHQSRVWRKATWTLLDQSLRSGSASLYDVHARMILAELITDIEGCSPRLKYLQATALTVAREISLHMIDAPNYYPMSEEDETMREIKRRTWWHLASTDWLLGIMGGSLERTYTVHPRHMRVNYPRDIIDTKRASYEHVDSPRSASTAQNSSAEMVYFIHRIRLAQICRTAIDALPLGEGDLENLPYDTCREIDDAFESALAALPVAAEKAGKRAAQCQILQLSTHARRVRLFRRFLRLPTGSGTPDAVPLKARFRMACRRSARAVLEIGLELLQDSLDLPPTPGVRLPQKHVGPPLHRNGCLMNHIFTTCAVLASDPILGPGGSGTSQDSDEGLNRDEIREWMKKLCEVLERVGESSVLAGTLMRRLVGVFRRHGVRGLVADPGRQAGSAAEDTSPDQELFDIRASQEVQTPAAITSAISPTLDMYTGAAMQGYGREENNFELSGIWDDLNNINTLATSNEWDQLFMDLDLYGGPVEF